MSCTVDASVLVASARPQEVHYAESETFLARVTELRVESFCPTIVLPESAAPIARATGSTQRAAELIRGIYRLPRLRLVAIDVRLAHRAAEIAMTLRLRGADSVYVAVAEASGSTLITWDTEMLERAPGVVPTMTPAEWLSQQGEQP